MKFQNKKKTVLGPGTDDSHHILPRNAKKKIIDSAINFKFLRCGDLVVQHDCLQISIKNVIFKFFIGL